jgi:hypothetical protein
MPKGNPNPVPSRRSVRKQFRRENKPYSKDSKEGSKLRRKARLERTIERAQRELAGEESDSSDYEDVDSATEGEKRAVVKFFWMTLGKPKRPSTWSGINGVISYIRRRMGSTAPSAAAYSLTRAHPHHAYRSKILGI